jgi:hypothetical protein
MAKTRRVRRNRSTKRKNRSRRQSAGGLFDSFKGLFGRKTQKVAPVPAPAVTQNAVPRNWANRLAKGKRSTVRSWEWQPNKYNTRAPTEAYNVLPGNIPYRNYTARKAVFSEAANVARRAEAEKAAFESKLIPLPPALNENAYNRVQSALNRRNRSRSPLGANKTVKSLRNYWEKSAFNQALRSQNTAANRARRAKYMANTLRRYPGA